MQKRRDDPEYQLHDLVRTDEGQEEPPPGATGPRSTGARPDPENTSVEVNRRINMDRPAPSEVRATEREHDPDTRDDR